MAAKIIVVLVIIIGIAMSASSDELSRQTTLPPLSTSPHATIDYIDIKGTPHNEDNGVDKHVDELNKESGSVTNEHLKKDENQKSSESDSFDFDLFNCSLPPTVDRYCKELPAEVREYFKNDLSISSLLTTILRKDMIDNLQVSCPPLSWCLSDSFHQFLIQGKGAFYSTNPLCSDDVWVCLETMLAERMSCNDKQLRFLVNAVDLLCSLDDAGRLPVSEECYSRALEALYVTYADLTNAGGSKIEKLEKSGCSEDKVQMTTTYICAHDVCNNNQRFLLEKFEFWKETATTATTTAASCKIEHKCQSPNGTDDYESTYFNDTPSPNSKSGEQNKGDNIEFGELEKIFEEVAQEAESDLTPEESKSTEESSTDASKTGEVNKDSIGTAGANDKAVIFGLLVMTSVLVIGFLGLAFLGYRRFCRNKCGYDTTGYSKLLDEEAKLLQAEYS